MAYHNRLIGRIWDASKLSKVNDLINATSVVNTKADSKAAKLVRVIGNEKELSGLKEFIEIDMILDDSVDAQKFLDSFTDVVGDAKSVLEINKCSRIEYEGITSADVKADEEPYMSSKLNTTVRAIGD